MTNIHPLAAVDPLAKLGDNVEVGPFSVIEAGAVIGDGCKIASHASITRWSRLANNVIVSTGAVIGSDPQDLKFEGEETFIEIGENTTIREYTTLNRGTKASGKTVIGKDCLIMAYVHIAHDCRIGDNVILVNNVTLGGHVELADWVILSSFVPVHQFVRIGAHAYVGGFWRVPLDVPPYIRAAGEPLTYKGVNSVGLKRRGFTPEQVNQISKAYRIFYRSKLNVSQALEKIKSEMEQTPEVQEIVNFIESRELRGLMK